MSESNGTINRVSDLLPTTPETPVTPKKPTRVRTRKPKAEPVIPEPKTVSEPIPEADHTARVALGGIALCGVMSAALNGYQHSLHAPSAWAGWALGIAVPALVLILGRVAGGCHRKGRWRVALSAALSGAALLAISVYHCAESISILTGSPLALSVPLALAIDCGLVSCEWALIELEK